MANAYTVEIDAPADETPCVCGSCEWTGPFSALIEIDGCSLTPGDPSPAGRCLKCDSLAYVDTSVLPRRIIFSHDGDE